MVRTRAVTILVSLVVLLPAAAHAVEVPEDLHVGIYSDDFDASGDLDGVAAAAGQRVTFGGTFHDVNENDSVETATWSNTRELLEGVWRGKATPFANVAIDASGFADRPRRLRCRHRGLAGPRSPVPRPWRRPKRDHRPASRNTTANWTPYGCDPSKLKTAPYVRTAGRS